MIEFMVVAVLGMIFIALPVQVAFGLYKTFRRQR